MYRWPGGILNYDLSQVVRSEHAALIRSTLSQLETKLDSCIKFREANSSPQVVVGDSGDVCQASVGYQSRQSQELSLSYAGRCMASKVIEHEFGLP